MQAYVDGFLKVTGQEKYCGSEGFLNAIVRDKTKFNT